MRSLLAKILAHAFLDGAAEFIPESGVFLWLVLGQIVQHTQHLLHRTAANRFDVLAFLQDFARHVERQVVGVDHPAHEAHVVGHELLGVVHDEDAAHIELDAVALLAVPQVERGARRDVEQLGVFLLAFHPGVNMGQRRFEVVRHMLVEFVVLFLRDLALGARPQGGSLVDGFQLILDHVLLLLCVPIFLVHHDGQGDVVGILADDGLDLPAGKELVLAFAQVQDHVGAATGLVHGFERVVTLSRRFPFHAMFGAKAGAAGDQGHLVGHDEGGIEAHAELADQVRIPGLIAGKRLEELARAGLGDGADMLDHFLAVHADAVVGKGNGARSFIEAHADLQIGISFPQRVVGQRLEAQLVRSIGGIGNQLAQENLLVAVQGVDHQLQQLLDFGLKAQGFLMCFNSHGSNSPVDEVKLENRWDRMPPISRGV